jgi:hypothetical protein
MSDMLVKPDFSDTQENLTPGEYNFRIVKGEPGKWEKQDGTSTHFIKWEMETVNEEDPKNNGRKMWDRTPINGKGAFRFKDFYKAATGEAYDPSLGDFDITSVYGNELSAIVVEKDGYMNVKTYAPIS